MALLCLTVVMDMVCILLFLKQLVFALSGKEGEISAVERDLSLP